MGAWVCNSLIVGAYIPVGPGLRRSVVVRTALLWFSSGWAGFIAALAVVVPAMLGCGGSVDVGGDPFVRCSTSSFAPQYQTAVVTDRESDIARFGANGVALAAFNLGGLSIAANVFVEEDGSARFTEGWVVVETGEEIGFEATGTLELVCGADELRGFDFVWGPTTVVRSTFDDRGEAVGVLAGLRIGTVAVDGGVDSAVVLRGDDVSGGRVVELDVVGPGPMMDQIAFGQR